MSPWSSVAIVAVIAGALAPLIGSVSAQERPLSFVDAATRIPGLVIDMRYAGDNNFVGRRIDGYEGARCLLTRKAEVALAAVQRGLRRRGLGLKVFDCYRPTRAVAHFVRWAKDLTDVANKRTFYPDVDKRDLFRLGYIAARSSHSRGSTVDLTLVRRADGRELDMGTGFDLFSPRSWPASKAVTAAQRENRQRLAQAMTGGGFKPLEQEWWHFTLRNEPFPTTYFDFVVR
jgi:D-alanyl-D-alanine dipeptidase